MTDSNTISSMVDAQLMLTIAQASATFVAIMAGFFTTKIISISSDRKRIENKIAEGDIKIKSMENNIRSYEETIDDTCQGWAEESIERFVNELLDQPLLEEYTLEQLKQKFTELEIHELNKYEIRILSEKYDEIMNNIREELKKRRNNYKLEMGLVTNTSVIHSLNLTLNPKTTDKQLEAVDEAYKKIQAEENEIAVLKNLKHQYKHEIKDISYPLSKWAFTSQLIFVVTGIIIPFNYKWWAPILFSSFDPNTFGLSMFYVGLSSAFFYIGLELWHSLHRKTTGKFNKIMAVITRGK